MIYVVGSGPAGVSCSYALVKKGIKVTMLDAGVELEPETASVLEKLQKAKKWNPLLLKRIRGDMQATVKGVPKKKAYGSDYPYKEISSYMQIIGKDVECSPSFAKGGLSTVWGAAVMPYLADDIKDWPVSIDELAPYYRLVLDFMKIASAKDDLASLFPLYTENLQNFQQSKQAHLLLKDMQRSKMQLNSAGIFFGSSRLAVQFTQTKEKHGCVYCGLCMHGCPYKLIYNSAFTVDELKKHNNFEYKTDIIVDKVVEAKGKIKIITHSRIDNKKLIFEGSRVFLACGALPTTKIMLESMGAYNQELQIKDSQYFLMHLLRYKGAGDVTKESLHALAQLYIEIFDKKLDKNSVHIQLYTYNDLYESALRHIFGQAYNILNKALKRFMSRLIIAQGYLHSKSSSAIYVKLKKGTPNKLILRKNENSITAKLVRAVAWKLFGNKKYFKFLPLIPFLKIGKPGESSHYGGSFPMSNNPKKFESDIFGRPFGFKKVHLADSSVFPSIPAQAITLTIMANAYRIADKSDKLE